MKEEEFEQIVDAEMQRIRGQREHVMQLAAHDTCGLGERCSAYRRRCRASRVVVALCLLSAVLLVSLATYDKPACGGFAGDNGMGMAAAIVLLDNTVLIV